MLKISFWISLGILLVTGCKKTRDAQATASLDIIHVVAGAGIMRPSFTETEPKLFRLSRNITYNTFTAMGNRFGSYIGDTRVRLYVLPDTLEKDLPLIDVRINLQVASINTLLLTGTKTAPDTMLIRETIPYFPDTDSVMAIRFINCASGSGVVNIRVNGGAAVPELSGLAYRQRSGFKTFPVLSSTKDYTFEARDAVTGALLATYKTNGMNTDMHGNFRYRSFTLILGGVAGETGANQPVFIVQQHYRTI